MYSVGGIQYSIRLKLPEKYYKYVFGIVLNEVLYTTYQYVTTVVYHVYHDLTYQMKMIFVPQGSFPSSSSLGEWRRLRIQLPTSTTTGYQSWWVYCPFLFCLILRTLYFPTSFAFWLMLLLFLFFGFEWNLIYWFSHQTVVIGSYLIAHGFFSVYAMCVDTLFLCFCK